MPLTGRLVAQVAWVALLDADEMWHPAPTRVEPWNRVSGSRGDALALYDLSKELMARARAMGVTDDGMDKVFGEEASDEGAEVDGGPEGGQRPAGQEA